MYKGNYVLILHTHLPWVLHHGKSPHGVDWLNEAVAECYIPLLNVFNDLVAEGISPNVTLDISPVLCEQLEHPDFKKIFIDYCDEKIAAAQRDKIEFTSRGYDPHHIWLTQFWEDWFRERKTEFTDKYDMSIIKGLKKLQDDGHIEVMTCGATHGYFPMLGFDRSVNLQVKAAVENYKKHFGREPRGTWLPECAYRPAYEWQSYLPVAPFNEKKLRAGVEQIIALHGIKYFVTDENLLLKSVPLGKFTDKENDVFVPVNSPSFQHTAWNFDKSSLRLYEVSSGVETQYGTAAAFVRHQDISMQVWSGEVGYPGQADYLDFHKKHVDSGLRYWRVTDTKADMMYKTLYHTDWTFDKIDLQTNHFIHHIENALNYYHNITGMFGTLCTPFDTELFGHWWFEGPLFIKSLLKGMHNSPHTKAATAWEQYNKINPTEVIKLPEGSWGEGNSHEVWSNDDNNWTWEAIYNNELRLSKIYESNSIPDLGALQRRILTQALRELMLLQSSDWQFLIYTRSAQDYAEQRFVYHHSDFNKLCDLFENYAGKSEIEMNDELYLRETEERNSIFPELNPEWWAEPFS
ncbi:MAG: hypothetical protein CVV22_08470 [Ignavibacteriae bacterium HGW-Ignavibacteriae-1]|jgi:1,4-alpha-glucan branching enzyme|nr:MAG: hypothetical protein CVV22_08470 [Ignavibacteriae bacterium HGW-Ignavibacteriae-1]